MNKGQMERAKRRALNILDSWIDVTGVIKHHSGYHSELEGIVEDAVECGAQMALGIRKPLSSEIPEIGLKPPFTEDEREAVIRECCRDVCMYCGERRPGFGPAQGPNEAGNYYHGGSDGADVLCDASSLWARIRHEFKPEA